MNVTEEATTVIKTTLKTTVTTAATATETGTDVDAAAAQATNTNSGERKTYGMLIFGLLATQITLTLC